MSVTVIDDDLGRSGSGNSSDQASSALSPWCFSGDVGAVIV